jgi:hypothetical protein
MASRKDRPAASKATDSRPRVAVIVRAHFDCEKLRDLARILKTGIGYEFFVFADQTHGPLDLPGEPVVPCSDRMCADLGLVGSLPPEYPIFWYFGDYAFYCALHSIPGFDYYIMIDYDVEFVRGNTYALESLIARLNIPGSPALDMVGPSFFLRTPDWVWSPDCQRVFPEVYGVFFPLVVLSKRAAEYLYEWRRTEAAAPPPKGGKYLMSEAFVASALVAAGRFHCADLNSVLPECTKWDTFRVNPAILLGNLPALDRSIEFVHPVYSLREYLKCDRSNPLGLPVGPKLPAASRNEKRQSQRTRRVTR